MNRQARLFQGHRKQAGFTLAELLIALALLGIIAAFTIPKLLSTMSTKETSSKVTEAITTLEQAFYNKKMQDHNTYSAGIVYGPGSTLYTNIEGSLNVLDKGPGSAATLLGASHPCVDPNQANAANGWIQFQDGIVVTGLNSGADFDSLPYNHPTHNQSQNYVICIDTNGKDNPNQAGLDVFVGNFNLHGAFTGVPTVQTERTFHWGTATNDVYAIGGASGTTLGVSNPRIGSASVQDSAVAGLMIAK